MALCVLEVPKEGLTNVNLEDSRNYEDLSPQIKGYKVNGCYFLCKLLLLAHFCTASCYGAYKLKRLIIEKRYAKRNCFNSTHLYYPCKNMQKK